MSWVLLCAITLDTYVERWMGFSIIYYMHVRLMEVLSFHNRQPWIIPFKINEINLMNLMKYKGQQAWQSCNKLHTFATNIVQTERVFMPWYMNGLHVTWNWGVVEVLAKTSTGYRKGRQRKLETFLVFIESFLFYLSASLWSTWHLFHLLWILGTLKLFVRGVGLRRITNFYR